MPWNVWWGRERSRAAMTYGTSTLEISYILFTWELSVYLRASIHVTVLDSKKSKHMYSNITYYKANDLHWKPIYVSLKNKI